jgi:hypothetical protein
LFVLKLPEHVEVRNLSLDLQDALT